LERCNKKKVDLTQAFYSNQTFLVKREIIAVKGIQALPPPYLTFVQSSTLLPRNVTRKEMNIGGVSISTNDWCALATGPAPETTSMKSLVDLISGGTNRVLAPSSFSFYWGPTVTAGGEGWWAEAGSDRRWAEAEMGGGGQWWAEAGGSRVRQVEVAESRMTKRSNGIEDSIS
jgi:hypothetical protein